MADINRTTGSMALPSELSSEVLKKASQESAIMRLADKVDLPGRGVTIPVIVAKPTAAWVAETEKKPVNNATPGTKLMQAFKLATIMTFSKELVRDAAALYRAIVDEGPAAIAKTFDQTVIGAVAAPSQSNFDTFAACTAVSIANANNGTYLGLVAANANIATAGGRMNGVAVGAQGESLLFSAVDTTGRPIFMPTANDGSIGAVLGSKIVENNGLYVAGTSPAPNVVGIAGDWTQAKYGIVNGIEFSISDQATLDLGNNTVINLWQQNMIAVLVEAEVGFRADTNCFNLLTD
jgi:HK97 family phage major capsid protein